MTKKLKHTHQDPYRYPKLQEPIEAEVVSLFNKTMGNMLMDVSKLLVAKVNESKDIEKGRKANIGGSEYEGALSL